jgi:flagellar biosynthesis GTPase FlhF
VSAENQHSPGPTLRPLRFPLPCCLSSLPLSLSLSTETRHSDHSDTEPAVTRLATGESTRDRKERDREEREREEREKREREERERSEMRDEIRRRERSEKREMREQR